MRRLLFDVQAWADCVNWQQTDRAVTKRINTLLQDVARNPFEGIGKPEPLRHQLAGCWSRRITDEHRLVYRVLDDRIEVLQVKYHY